MDNIQWNGPPVKYGDGIFSVFFLRSQPGLSPSLPVLTLFSRTYRKKKCFKEVRL